MSLQDQDVVSLRAGEAVQQGDIVRVSANNTVVKARANNDANLAGLLGVVQKNTSGSGQTNIVVGGIVLVRLEAALAPAAGDTVYVSAATAGLGTNVPPANAEPIGKVIDTALYASRGLVSMATMLSGSAGGGSGGLPDPVTGDLNFSKETAHTIRVNDSTTVGVAGGSLNITSGAGVANPAGAGTSAGVIQLNGGVGGNGSTDGGTGANIQSFAGNGGAGAAGTGGPGGSFFVTAGNGGNGTAGGGLGGAVAITAGASGVPLAGNVNGILGGSTLIAGGLGGPGSGTGNGGQGGPVTIEGGGGGQGDPGGLGGDIVVRAGIGGFQIGTAPGAGGFAEFLGGAGGPGAAAANGGNVSLRGGPGNGVAGAAGGSAEVVGGSSTGVKGGNVLIGGGSSDVAGGGDVDITGGSGAPTGNVNIGIGNTAEVNIGDAAVVMSFFGGAGSARPTIVGAKGGNVALANLLTALDTLGLLIDNTT